MSQMVHGRNPLRVFSWNILLNADDLVQEAPLTSNKNNALANYMIKT